MINIEKLIGLKSPLILASASPRRRKLLKDLGFNFTIQPSNINEEIVEEISETDYAEKLALAKAQEVASRFNENGIVIGADTIVVIDNKILNKPKTKDEAFEMLNQLSGRTHKVITGLSLVEIISKKYIISNSQTLVTFRELEKEEIEAYINSGSPFDKAGGYGIQDDFGAVFVSRIEGCYYNVVGLPLELLYKSLKEFNTII